ncbi:cytidylyltransferase domain-containing protein [Thalassotalea crassostreae]|uniref:acylneuraminate cytidylyltransferase family protein n=1 Tax=Thalassotalea crassostreae TaxID=1763536 RepID=UPI0008384FAA|nr:acylneuraminate cytidylyltransferase family protein [Thalassotalea crassostreae]
MHKENKCIALIPARGGSKRLPNKNVLALNGSPLIAWTIRAALASQYISKVYVTTDCQKIADVAIKYGAEVPFIRPDYLSSDTATSNDVLLHAIDKVGLSEGDSIMLLQPTSPLRSTLHIDESIELFRKRKAGGVVSVCQCEHSPLWSNTLPSDNSMGDFLPPNLISKRSQDIPKYFRLNGAIYLYGVKGVKENNGIYYDSSVFAYEMKSIDSVDIDESIDFKLAQVLLNEKVSGN